VRTGREAPLRRARHAARLSSRSAVHPGVAALALPASL